MPDPNPTVDELFKAKVVTDEQLNAAIDAYLSAPDVGANRTAEGYRLGAAATVAGHGWASSVMDDPKVTSGFKRGAVWTAVVLARAQKAIKQRCALSPAMPPHASHLERTLRATDRSYLCRAPRRGN